MNNKNIPEVSVCIPTYYHEKYISQAINSVLEQKVSFKYEIIVSDDCSKDNTQSIIMDYSKKIKNIKYFFHKENIGLTNNLFFARSKCSGKYIMCLSGDDYWIDKYKMQKQYEFLEKNRDYVAVSTRICVRKDTDINNNMCLPDIKCCNKRITFDMFLKGSSFPRHGMMIRNPFLNTKFKKDYALMPKLSRYIDDYGETFLILKNGDAYILDDVTYVYRKITKKDNSNNFNSINTYLSIFSKYIEVINNIDKYCNGKYDLTNLYKSSMQTGIIAIIFNHDISSFKRIYLTIPKKYRKRNLIIYGLYSLTRFAFNRISLKIKHLFIIE